MGRSWHYRGAALGVAAIFVTLVAACDSGPSALPARDHSQAAVDRAAATAALERQADGLAAEARARSDETPTYEGKPLWSANRKYTAQENAEYHFKRNGDVFGARTVDEFVGKAHAFVTDPPKGSLTLKRANGDILIYDAKANVFAVKTKDGAPRTMFKPDDGMAYWERQKDKERDTQSASRSSGRDSEAG